MGDQEGSHHDTETRRILHGNAPSFALLAYGLTCRDTDPLRALDALRRGPVIAQDSGSRIQESYLAMGLARLEAEHGDPRAALEYFTVAIRNYDDSGSTTTFRAPLGGPIAGFAIGSPMTANAVPEVDTVIAHLRNVLGDQTYESLARKAETMTTAAIVTYAYDQIDQARAELNAVS